MGFGQGYTLRLPVPSFRGDLIDDMKAVAEGRLGGEDNSLLIQTQSNIFTDVSYVTKNGSIIAAVGTTIVGGTDKVGTPDTYELGGL